MHTMWSPVLHHTRSRGHFEPKKISPVTRHLERQCLCTFERKHTNRHTNAFQRKVKSFFLGDDVSRITTGRKQTITVQEAKMKKRFLEDTMKNDTTSDGMAKVSFFQWVTEDKGQ